MQLRCIECPYVCKRLEQDEPELAVYENCSPALVIEFFERALKNYNGPTLQTIQCCSSHGHQLAVLLSNKREDASKPQAQGPILLLCQCAETPENKTIVTLRFDVPVDCMAIEKQTHELSRIVKGILSLLRRKDRRASST